MGDQEAWLELCDLYVNEGEYGKAAFSLEEVILLNPHCHFYHQKYAEIRYTMGGYDNVELARSYFCQVSHSTGKFQLRVTIDYGCAGGLFFAVRARRDNLERPFCFQQ
jgi:hypothetical protein